MRQPFTALVSITHRIAGVALFGAVAVLLYLLDRALSSPEGFAEVADSAGAKWLLVLIVCAMAYHFFVGIKHLLLDFHLGDTMVKARWASALSVVLAALTAVWLGNWIW